MNQYQKGLIRAIIFYSIGAIVTIITHQIYGWEYIHAPPPSSLPLLLFSFVGFVRSIRNVKNIRAKNDPEINKGELTILILPSIALAILILALVTIN
jgi:hypothetical protein